MKIPLLDRVVDRCVLNFKKRHILFWKRPLFKWGGILLVLVYFEVNTLLLDRIVDRRVLNFKKESATPLFRRPLVKWEGAIFFFRRPLVKWEGVLLVLVYFEVNTLVLDRIVDRRVLNFKRVSSESLCLRLTLYEKVFFWFWSILKWDRVVDRRVLKFGKSINTDF